LFSRLRNRFELKDSGHDRIFSAPYFSGCFMLFRIDALEEIGLFDDRFFMYPEDIDISRRIASSKYAAIYYPYVEIIHEHAADSKKSFKMFFIHVINIIKYFNKWGWFFDSNRKKLNSKTLAQFL
jgi:GT2 family glycosyltransferase